MAVTSVNENSRISNNYSQAKAFVNKSDAEIWMYANKASHDASEQKNTKRRLKVGLIGLPVAVFASAISTSKASVKHLLSKKLFAGTKALGALTGVSAILTAVFTGEAIAIHNHPSIKKFHKKHPVAAELLDLFVGFEAVDLAFALGFRGLRKAGNKFPEAKEHAKASIDSIAETLDKSDFNKKTMRNTAKAIRDFSKKHSVAAKTLKIAVKYSPFIVVGGVLGASVSAAQKHANKRDAIYNSMKHAQMETAKSMVNKLDDTNRKLMDDWKHQSIENHNLKLDLADAKNKLDEPKVDKTDNKPENDQE
jgi:hypothetical protein